MRRLLALAFFVSVAQFSFANTNALSADDYPSRSIRLIVRFSPGGGNDVLARLVAEKLGQMMQQDVIVENRPSAGGINAAAFVMSQPPDGYTILMGASGAMVFAPIKNKTITYPTVKDFVPISLLTYFPLVMVVSADHASNTVDDVIRWSKSNAASANYASPSPAFSLVSNF
jgi:tripartite-type tricarboxylate transporter receptor subunit TctC